jgi:hypothetical protein
MSFEKNKCYSCVYRRNIPGDAHSMCSHPAAGGAEDMFNAIVAIGSGQAARGAQELGIKANTHGIRMGWFHWPANFDPVWLATCKGFTPRAEESGVQA